MTRRSVAALLLTAAVLVSGCSLTPEESTPQPTAKAMAGRLPDVTMPSIEGGPSVDLGELRGPAVVNVWASFCEPCKRELPIYAAFAKRHAGEIDVLGIDFQDQLKDKARAMMRTAGVEYPVAYDFDGELRAFALPKLVLVDEAGKVVYDQYVEIKSAAQLEDLVAEHLGAAS